ncbi:beta-ketoacyl synthase N-terminal-like domain-containing protein [Actinokineospora guangxiensis]|uniref:Beta-ketoacyl synthase N-terminal-like domain-containing protein n=1 Tax=Actinokineospora guangxiensis TaxID=1490288 RepID=A0ABW0EMR2_9PSEU
MRPTVVQGFADAALRWPDAVAIGGADPMTYAQLAARVGGIARALTGIAPGDRIGIALPHGPRAIAGVLGALAAGAAYVPLDPAFPARRRAEMAATAGLSAVLTDASTALPGIRIDDLPDSPLTPAEPGEAAYVLFTSGSTGVPKAVAQTHDNLRHVVDNQIATLGIRPGDSLSLLASLSFDAAIPDLFPALLTGATVVPIDVRAVGVADTARLLAEHEVTVYHSTPTLYRYLLDTGVRLPAVRTVLLGGEQAAWSDLRRGIAVFGEDCLFVNGYGATEVTFAAQFRVPAADLPDTDGPVPIGFPLPGFDVRLAPDGELVVTGQNLLGGYLSGPGDRFGVDPDGTPTYRTGDLGRRDPDGSLVCLGRLDRQLKVRGHRVEPAEVEAALTAASGARSRVIVRDERLLGYVESTDADPAAVRSAIAEVLPPHCVPQSVVAVAAFPLTVTGKVDERALPEPATAAPGRPMSDTERVVHDAWCAVLGVASVDLDVAFFDAGGHSLTLGALRSRLAADTGGDIPIARLFQHSTVAAQARYLDAVTRPADRGVTDPTGDTSNEAQDGPDQIAVVGLSCRFPGAPDAATFWWNLCAGVDSVHDHTDAELAALGIGPGLRADPAHVRGHGALPGVEDFDAAFFGFTPAEAETTDPQHRLFLEAAWSALEDAGHDPAREPGRVGVFASASVNRYFLYHLFDNPAVAGGIDPDDWEGRLLGRHQADHLPGQIAYRLGLTGPAMAVQSACSSALVAVCEAAQNLADYRCDTALAGGVAVVWPRHRAGGMSSPDGRCRAFDEAAAGTGYGSGVGVVVLRRLSDALADGDHVYAVLPGWGVTNDGAERAGFAVPGPTGQAEAIADALAAAGIDAGDVGFVEAHGSGTPLGDAIEVAALTDVFGDVERCALGSVKTNIGHLDAAAGIAGLIKAVLAVRHGLIPPSLHFTAPHPDVDLGPFTVPTKVSIWPAGRRVAGVSSFGVGGTNAHVLVQQSEEDSPGEVDRRVWVLPVSARDPRALAQALVNLREHIAEHAPRVADVAYTLATGRRAFDSRVAVVCTDETVLAALDAAIEEAHDSSRPESLAARLGRKYEVDPTLVGTSSYQSRKSLISQWMSGQDVEWAAEFDGQPVRRVPLPAYPFQRSRYWIDPPGKEVL